MASEATPKIFSTDKGVVMIQSETKNRMIEILEKEERTGAEIRERLDRAKSTVSVHLSDLMDLGIIGEKGHPEDERKKIFYLKSKFLGQSGSTYDEHYRCILKNLKGSERDEYEFLKSLFHLIRYGLISFGLDLHPALKEIGRDVGRNLAEDFFANEPMDLLEEIGEFWRDMGLGKMVISSREEIIVKECFDCQGMPDIGHNLCTLDEGMLEGLLETKLDEKVDVVEEECHGTGSGHCKFKLVWN